MQDNLRSAVYRSLTKNVTISSQDCNGRVGSRTRTRHKTSCSAAMELEMNKEEEKAMAHKDCTGLQLLQVSKGAQKLSQMIELWCKTQSIHDGRSEGFAQDLLKGALDLEQSLAALENLWDSSNLSVRMHLRAEPEPNTSRRHCNEEETLPQGLGSISYLDRRKEPYFPAHGSSIDCVQELKQTLKGNGYLQESPPSSDVKNIPSSRSLRFTVSNLFDRTYFDQSAVKEDLVFAEDEQNRTNAPNLVVKLMGLEKEPSKIVQHHKREERNKTLIGARLDIQMPKARKKQTRELNFGLEESLDTVGAMHIEGLLERNQIDKESVKTQPTSFQPSIFNTIEQKLYLSDSYEDSNVPPITIMKPMHSLLKDGEIKKKVASYKTYRKEANPSDKVIQTEKDFNIRTTSSYMMQKEVEHIPTAIANSSFNKKNSASRQQNQQREKGIIAQLKLDKRRVAAKLVETKGYERNIVRTTQAVIHQPNAPKPARSDKISQPGNIDASPQARAHGNQTKCASKLIKNAPASSTKQMDTMGSEAIRQFNTIKAKNAQEVKSRGEEMAVPRNETDGDSLVGNNSLSDPPFKQIEQNCKPYSEVQEYEESKALDKISVSSSIEDDKYQRVGSCEVMPKANQLRTSSWLTENTAQIRKTRSNIGIKADAEDDTTCFLLTCQSFFASAKQHFDLHPRISLHDRSNTTKEMGIQNAKLYSCLAEELMARRSHWHKHKFSPFLQICCSWRIIHISFDKLVQEISTAIKGLANYSTGNVTESCGDRLYVRLEKDLKCEDVTMNSVWDIGWLNNVCLEAADEVIDEIGDGILSSLIGEEAMELL